MSSAPVHLLLRYLDQLQDQGIKRVFLDEGARSVLRQWHRAKNTPKAPANVPLKELSPSRDEPVISHAAAPSAPTPAPRDWNVPERILVEGDHPREKLRALFFAAKSWTPGMEMPSLRQKLVFASGNPEADLMFIGEAPGYHEELQSQPFVGPAGDKLTQILTAMGLTREQVYLTNLCKLRPKVPGQTTNNRKPTLEEIEVWMPFVRTEIEIVQPKLIVALGTSAAQGLLQSDLPVTQLRGEFHQFNNIPVRVTYHPSYLLHRQSANNEKRQVWEDMLAVMEALTLPISDKQRGFFLPKN